jgi:hypothetical protein
MKVALGIKQRVVPQGATTLPLFVNRYFGG